MQIVPCAFAIKDHTIGSNHLLVTADGENQGSSDNVGHKVGHCPILGHCFVIQCHQQDSPVVEVQEPTAQSVLKDKNSSRQWLKGNFLKLMHLS